MMTVRQVWLKAMTIVEARGAVATASMVDTLMEIVSDEADLKDWARVASAVDTINNGQMQ
ncbi:hypothetical protein [Sphingomonas sp. CFBP 8765]|uniref:hypothetical protein n=1 Tax=unclassified Sphingomonas TaxID=196159 RepID=UPI00178398AB|nr:hypothetical protein [Sphingomonas sp. CFBP 8765]MBD8472226.1 hypothetical protein [Sphingomonas sp. CFBP 8765]